MKATVNTGLLLSIRKPEIVRWMVNMGIFTDTESNFGNFRYGVCILYVLFGFITLLRKQSLRHIRNCYNTLVCGQKVTIKLGFPRLCCSLVPPTHFQSLHKYKILFLSVSGVGSLFPWLWKLLEWPVSCVTLTHFAHSRSCFEKAANWIVWGEKNWICSLNEQLLSLVKLKGLRWKSELLKLKLLTAWDLCHHCGLF